MSTSLFLVISTLIIIIGMTLGIILGSKHAKRMQLRENISYLSNCQNKKAS